MIHDLGLSDVRFAVIDTETTGFSPGFDRIVEIAVVYLEPSGEVRLALETLVRPPRELAGSEIHGLSPADLEDAPPLRDVFPMLASALAGRVVVGHNVSFDLRFLSFEAAEQGASFQPPHVCTLELGRLLSPDAPGELSEACREVGIRLEARHSAAADAMAAAKLFDAYRERLARRSITRFAQLADLGESNFVKSFGGRPVSPFGAATGLALKPRPGSLTRPRTGDALAIRTYFAALLEVLADIDVTEEELERLAEMRTVLGLDVDQVRALHAQAFGGAILTFVSDQRLDASERVYLERLWKGLARAGWAPGQ